MANCNSEDNLREKLQQLVAEACSYPATDPEKQRQKKLNQIVKDVTESGKLWKKNEFYYHDALQETWKYCCQNIEKYDPNRGSVINWINYYLKRRLQDFRIKEDSSNARTEPHFTSKETGEIIDPVDTLKASSDIPPMLEETRDWVQTDSDGVLRNTIFRKRPEINAQVLILLRIIPIAEWENFAWENVTPQFQPWALTGGKPQGFAEAKEWDNIWAQFELNKAEKLDLPKFYSRRCLPLLQKFGKEQGYDIDDSAENDSAEKDRKNHSNKKHSSKEQGYDIDDSAENDSAEKDRKNHSNKKHSSNE